jgi:hypothetical protein
MQDCSQLQTNRFGLFIEPSIFGNCFTEICTRQLGDFANRNTELNFNRRNAFVAPQWSLVMVLTF